MKVLLPALLLLACGMLAALTNADIQFLLDTEQYQLLNKHEQQLVALLDGSEADIRLALDWAARTGNDPLALRCHGKLALHHHSIEDALQWINLADRSGMDSLAVAAVIVQLQSEFSAPEDKVILDYFLYDIPQEDYLEQIRQLRGYSPFIEDLAKSWADEISVEPSDSLAMGMIDRFEYYFPVSKWAQVAFYYRLFHLSKAGDFTGLAALIDSQGNQSPASQYISALFLLSPSYRRSLPASENTACLDKAASFLKGADSDPQNEEDLLVLYDTYTPRQWTQRIRLMLAKTDYYRILASLGMYGDEEGHIALLKKPDSRCRALLDSLRQVDFADNDRGDLAELHFWLGKVQGLAKTGKSLQDAARSFSQSLIYGSPRKKYDESCLQALRLIHDRLRIKIGLNDWIRKMMGYSGIVFEEYTFPGQRYTRVAIGDYDNDGFNDLLFNGNALIHNERGKAFTNVSDSTNVAELRSNGGLWADFNRDGQLDFATISNNSDGLGEALMKNQGAGRFVKVNERAGDIDDTYPTEGAAWIDTDGQGYPSLYTANYEKWQQRSGYPDFFWHNDKGYFTDESVSRGFRTPPYTDNPGQAGRGVAPADFDNDGTQEILVTNYRLNRNFCWKQQDSLFVDVAPLYGLTGKYKEGYYGHSIGADWGDYDNDGDLDLFVANLAHPRFIDISDVSQLLRNDGLVCRVVESDTLWFWQFTDVTKAAGITYDELHSDPLWLDADNDGRLDLFITSVYENDRSYLYHNNGDGTFTDITWLANARVYNGWGNATGDLDRDGLADLVVGSGNGTKILFNRTKTKNKALCVKPVWKGDAIVLAKEPDEFSQYPNSPAFGARVRVTVNDPDGKIRYLVRELSSAKGTTSQNAQELHFGLGRGKAVSIERVKYAQDQD